jgi:hypothetical protein
MTTARVSPDPAPLLSGAGRSRVGDSLGAYDCANLRYGRRANAYLKDPAQFPLDFPYTSGQLKVIGQGVNVGNLPLPIRRGGLRRKGADMR